jgi:PAS domain S-box-containing protein
LIGSFSFNLILQTRKAFESIDQFNQLAAKQTLAANIRYCSTQLLMATNDFMITERNDYKNNFYSFYEKLLKYKNEFESYNLDQRERIILDEIIRNIDSTKVYSEKIFNSYGEKNSDRSRRIELMEAMDYKFGEQIEKSVNELFGYISGKILLANHNIDIYKDRLFLTIFLSGLVFLIVTLITSYLTSVKIAKPILILSKAAESLGKGDYSVRPKINTKDEIAILANALSSMAESIELSYKSLRQSQQFNESIVKTIPSALIVVGKNRDDESSPESFSKGIVKMVNQSFSELFGISADEVVGKTIKETLSEINLSDLCKEVVVKGTVVENVLCECNSPRKGKLVLNLSLAGFELGEENILIVINDVTELKRAEDAIILEKERAQSYLDIAGVMLVVINADQNVSLINRKGSQILGYNESEVIGKNWFDSFIPPETKELVKTTFSKLMNGKIDETKYFENEIVTKSGEKRFIAWHNTLLQDYNNRITGTLSSGEDITDRRNAELATQKYMLELKELNAQKDRLFSIISHDLRSPFTGLLGYSEMLVDDFDEMERDEIKTHIAAIKEISENIFVHLSNLLEWSRLQRGKIKINPEKLTLNTIIKDIVELMMPNAGKKEISLITEVDENIFVNADQSMLNSILQNLISNAIKFTYEKGTIRIRANIKNDFVEIIVADSGIGMTDEEINKVFKIDASYTTKGTAGEIGTGLGLVICKEMVEKQGGKINIESEKDKGSQFKFTLPIGLD